MSYGYCGKILRVDLTAETVKVETPDEKFHRTYFGGQALFACHLLRELEDGIDPLGPKNKMVFATGAVTGAPFAGSGRNSVGAESPLTGLYGDSEAGVAGVSLRNR